ncbi:MAG: homocysteine S-methyltransferase [Gemmatimonadales bacterium]|nr:homocysteine S-methyltransferase [Gemmatimonadales bacterium]NIN12624.1 homocysteine S-methyltransferase [Gemmatimonadales bacterium]NIR02417.1 homocysteine S-methyltransferase [Gemmatimonadales bacterium]NIS66208.1 homocysteine S-methyltransferase [Gemmatimonadales bacterium]
MVLDGGLATALEARGFDLDDELWSAKILLDAPDAIRAVHLDFLAAGADCIATSTYQATLPGFHKRGLSDVEGVELFRLSVRLAVEARDAFWSEPGNRQGRLRPLVAASVGPYGAFLADGSEYTGRYGIGDGELHAFHRHRWHVLADSQADLLACETIPSRREAGVLLELLRETPGRWAWMSFSCRDGAHLSDGGPIIDVARACDAAPGVAAVGVNCTAPQFISSLIAEVRRGTEKPIIVYPNSGERYDAVHKSWVATQAVIDWEVATVEWYRLGAAAIGGCCRVGPEVISAMRRQLVT